MKNNPSSVAATFVKITEFMNGIGRKGIGLQSAINERFFIGDQWYGARVGNRPLVRRNIIKRIGEYKIATLTAAPIAVNYSADGVPNNAVMREQEDTAKETLINGGDMGAFSEQVNSALAMDILTNYFSTTAERLKFADKCEQAVRSAYITGTGIAYTWWDSTIKTGLYADEGKTTPIKGDIGFEILDVENVRFGDPNNEDIQTQPYIIVAQRRFYKDVRREARRNGIPEDVIQNIVPDLNIEQMTEGEYGIDELTDTKRVTVYTKFWKDYNEDGTDYVIKAYRCTMAAPVREEWDLGIKLYPFAKFVWERRRCCAYGDSEITHIIPNQIAINRAYTALVWQQMITGLPITVINGDIVTQDIMGEPGEIIKVFGASEDVRNAIGFVQPPVFAPQMQNVVASLANDTLMDSGATDAALGQEKPDNASALIQMREAALQPMQVYQNRYYSFVEDIARIWADFWLNKYGTRPLKINDGDDSYYVVFDADKFKNLIINAKIDVGASTIWNTAVVVSTLDGLLSAGIITPEQYLERMPNGMIPNKSGLVSEMKNQAEMQEQTSDSAILSQFAEQNPELYGQYMAMSPEEQQTMLQSATQRAGINNGSEQNIQQRA